jgi:hypothetical protein
MARSEKGHSQIIENINGSSDTRSLTHVELRISHRWIAREEQIDDVNGSLQLYCRTESGE